MGFIRVPRSLFVAVLTTILSIFSSYSEANKFYVGGKDGSWVLNPPENYNHWAERTRFQVNDTLYFKYTKGSDSVLVVTKDDYFSCKTSNPILSLTDGGSLFTFDRSGPFFFISGNVDNCKKGQKLIVVVLAVRPKPQPYSPPPSPSPSSAPAPPVAPSRSPVPATQPPSLSPPTASPPAGSPESGQAPSDLDTPAPAPAPVAKDKSSTSRVVAFGWSFFVFSAVVAVGL